MLTIGSSISKHLGIVRLLLLVSKNAKFRPAHASAFARQSPFCLLWSQVGLCATFLKTSIACRLCLAMGLHSCVLRLDLSLAKSLCVCTLWQSKQAWWTLLGPRKETQFARQGCVEQFAVNDLLHWRLFWKSGLEKFMLMGFPVHLLDVDMISDRDNLACFQFQSLLAASNSSQNPSRAAFHFHRSRCLEVWQAMPCTSVPLQPPWCACSRQASGLLPVCWLQVCWLHDLLPSFWLQPR